MDHKKLYPEQYQHPMVGKLLRFKDITFECVRVNKSRFGLLAVRKGGDRAFRVADCEVVTR